MWSLLFFHKNSPFHSVFTLSQTEMTIYLWLIYLSLIQDSLPSGKVQVYVRCPRNQVLPHPVCSSGHSAANKVLLQWSYSRYVYPVLVPLESLFEGTQMIIIRKLKKAKHFKRTCVFIDFPSRQCFKKKWGISKSSEYPINRGGVQI